MVEDRGVTDDPTYLRHNGKPIVSIWGVGFNDGRDYTLEDCAQLIDRIAMDGRFSVAIEDVQKVAEPVLRHRISTNFQAQAEGMTTEDIIARLLKEIPVPEIPKFAG